MTRTCRGRRYLVAALAAFIADSAAAQAVRVTAADSVGGAPLAEALVRVEAEDGSLAGAGFTAADGSVVLRVRQPGTYRVWAERSGYTRGEVSGIAVVRGAPASVTIRMGRRPFTLDTVMVVTRADRMMGLERGRDGFARRRSYGLGVFLDSAYVTARRPRTSYAIDLLGGIPGIRLMTVSRSERFARSDRGWKCLKLLLDGQPLNLNLRGSGPRRELNHVIGPRDVVSVEVYREFAEVPPEFRIYTENGMYNCGLILIWTRSMW
jgi:Carboxypeptidase regulatory-like domain